MLTSFGVSLLICRIFSRSLKKDWHCSLNPWTSTGNLSNSTGLSVLSTQFFPISGWSSWLHQLPCTLVDSSISTRWAKPSLWVYWEIWWNAFHFGSNLSVVMYERKAWRRLLGFEKREFECLWHLSKKADMPINSGRFWHGSGGGDVNCTSSILSYQLSTAKLLGSKSYTLRTGALGWRRIRILSIPITSLLKSLLVSAQKHPECIRVILSTQPEFWLGVGGCFA